MNKWRAVRRQAALLLGCLGRDEPHVRPGDRLTDCLRIGSIVLLPLHIGLNIGRWHQPNRVAKRMQLTRLMMRRRASLNTNKARC